VPTVRHSTHCQPAKCPTTTQCTVPILTKPHVLTWHKLSSYQCQPLMTGVVQPRACQVLHLPSPTVSRAVAQASRRCAGAVVLQQHCKPQAALLASHQQTGAAANGRALAQSHTSLSGDNKDPEVVLSGHQPSSYFNDRQLRALGEEQVCQMSTFTPHRKYYHV
jgi:hypothetical protein